ncbi:MAG: DUF2336 domain-containing protein [Alphaproteobacteria bacterium]|nr:MAG: DUF2336 domain-containing protein [Alphaproteobacteria bacterium]
MMSEEREQTLGQQPISYDEARRLLERGRLDDRRALAQRQDMRPEILYFLAEDEDREVRRAVAANPAAPIHADQLLARDSDDEVRLELARKIARLVPDLPPDESIRIRERAIELLESLARDALPKVRAMVAEEIKRSDRVPREIVRQLARDLESIVCCPVLEYSPLLDENDLRELIAAGMSSEALSAIARRENLDETVSDDIAATLDVPAVAALLANDSAQIREDTLDRLIDQAREVAEWHQPLAMRPQLSIRAMKRIAGFVASALVHRMMERNPIDEKLADEILDRVRQRIAEEQVGDDEAAELAAKARDFHRRGMLNDEFVHDAIENNRRELLIQCLAVMADIEPAVVRRILLSKSGRAVTALAWKAGLKMRTAFKMQTELALVSPSQLVPAKEGRDYPMDESELVWHLSYFLED